MNIKRDLIGKVIRQRRVVTEFICSKCNSKYHTLFRAQKCSAMPVEPRRFAKGDHVTWLEPATCDQGQRPFRIKATVFRVTKPAPMDEEYTNKWLGGELAGMHVRQYEVAFRCLCGNVRTMLLYAAEMHLR